MNNAAAFCKDVEDMDFLHLFFEMCNTVPTEIGVEKVNPDAFIGINMIDDLTTE